MPIQALQSLEKNIQKRIRLFEQKNGIRLDDEMHFIRSWFSKPLSIGSITIGCALGYLDYRFDSFGWRGQAPRLAAWYATLQARPSFQATEAVDG